MFCRFCGAKLNDNAKFCPKCGKSVQRNQAAAPPASQAQAATSQAAPRQEEPKPLKKQEVLQPIKPVQRTATAIPSFQTDQAKSHDVVDPNLAGVSLLATETDFQNLLKSHHLPVDPAILVQALPALGGNSGMLQAPDGTVILKAVEGKLQGKNQADLGQYEQNETLKRIDFFDLSHELIYSVAEDGTYYDADEFTMAHKIDDNGVQTIVDMHQQSLYKIFNNTVLGTGNAIIGAIKKI